MSNVSTAEQAIQYLTKRMSDANIRSIEEAETAIHQEIARDDEQYRFAPTNDLLTSVGIIRASGSHTQKQDPAFVFAEAGVKAYLEKKAEGLRGQADAAGMRDVVMEKLRTVNPDKVSTGKVVGV